MTDRAIMRVTAVVSFGLLLVAIYLDNAFGAAIIGTGFGIALHAGGEST